MAFAGIVVAYSGGKPTGDGREVKSAAHFPRSPSPTQHALIAGNCQLPGFLLAFNKYCKHYQLLFYTTGEEVGGGGGSVGGGGGQGERRGGRELSCGGGRRQGGGISPTICGPQINFLPERNEP